MRKVFRKVLMGLFPAVFGAFLVALWFVAEGYRIAPAVLQSVYEQPMPLKLSDFTSFQVSALLKVQDPSFYSHPGADFVWSDGVWTTITEGLVKQLYFHPFRPGFLHFGKIKQILLAIGFNRRVAKDEQLRVFVNRAYLGNVAGHSINGFDDGARVYYGKPFAKLSEEEYLGLVATLSSPATLSPANPKNNTERAARIRRLIHGECAREGKWDVFLAGCAK